jgi:hypothetical protein
MARLKNSLSLTFLCKMLRYNEHTLQCLRQQHSVCQNDWSWLMWQSICPVTISAQIAVLSVGQSPLLTVHICSLLERHIYEAQIMS